MTHTPTPWPTPFWTNDVNPGYREWWEIEGVAMFDKEADAEFARKAVNSHDKLVEALRALADDRRLALGSTHRKRITAALEGLE